MVGWRVTVEGRLHPPCCCALGPGLRRQAQTPGSTAALAPRKHSRARAPRRRWRLRRLMLETGFHIMSSHGGPWGDCIHHFCALEASPFCFFQRMASPLGAMRVGV